MFVRMRRYAMNNSWMKLAAAAVLAAGLAAAQTPAPQPPPGPGRLAPRAGIARRILANLGLTPAQRQQARDILQKGQGPGSTPAPADAAGPAGHGRSREE